MRNSNGWHRRVIRLVVAMAAFAPAEACLDRETTHICPRVESGVSVTINQTGTEAIDLVLMVDNSGSMATHQVQLQQQIPNLINPLVNPPLDAMGNPLYPPVQDLHVGIVSSDLGSGTYNIMTCRASDRGLFINQYRPPSGSPQYDPTCTGTSYPTFLSWTAAGTGTYPASALVHDVSCLATLGTTGCGLEEPLESVYQALTTHLSTGDGLNNIPGNDFLRPDSLLAIIFLSDEEDCSVRDYSLFDPNNTALGNLNLRCYNSSNQPTYEWPTSRYAQGYQTDVLPLHSVQRIVLAGIVGIPLDLNMADPATILADPRMQYTTDPADPSNVLPSCQAGTVVAYPSRRVTETTQPYYAVQNGVLYSICSSDFGPAMQTITRLIQSRLVGRCMQRTLQYDMTTCQSTCRVTQTLPAGNTSCAIGDTCPADCLAATNIPCDPADADCGKVVAGGQLQCTIPQVQPTAATPNLCACSTHATTSASTCPTMDPSLNGWFYDPSDLVNCPSSAQFGKVVFWGSAVPVSGSSVVVQCLSAVPPTMGGGCCDCPNGDACQAECPPGTTCQTGVCT